MNPNQIERTLSRCIKNTSDDFPILLIIGARQVGKTTLLQSLQEQTRQYVSLDDPIDCAMAKNDPAGFLQRYGTPLLIDEIQYAPELLPYIKMSVDKSHSPGMFWLTGSQQFHLMKNVSESLAGRIAILDLYGISLAEEEGFARLAAPFLPDYEKLAQRSYATQPLLIPNLYHRIWRGSFPFIVTKGEKIWERFYRSYVATYLQRDVRDFAHVTHEDIFLKFLQVIAVRTGQLINYADLARDTGVSEPTIKSWLTVLRASNLIELLQPYHNNLTKRLVKTPKLYFLDTGLCSFLAGWNTAEVLERGAMSGAILETFVVSEIIKSYRHNGIEPHCYFYRDRDKKEIDLLIERDGKLYPIEIKKTASPRLSDIKNFSVLEHLDKPIGHGGVICCIDTLKPLTDTLSAIPVSYI
jgi:uncharacterized protein